MYLCLYINFEAIYALLYVMIQHLNIKQIATFHCKIKSLYITALYTSMYV